MVFDLDPGEGVTWAAVQEAALLTRTLLDELGLQSWLKTSGGKGLHVVVPLAPRLDYDTRQGLLAGGGAAPGAHDPVALRRQERRRATGSARSSSTTCATATARRPRRRSRRARGPGSASRCRCRGSSCPTLKSGAQWTIATAREYLSFQNGDPWADYWSARQTLTKAMKTLAASAPLRAAESAAPCPESPSANLLPRFGRRRCCHGRSLDRFAVAQLRPGVDPGEGLLGHRERGRRQLQPAAHAAARASSSSTSASRRTCRSSAPTWSRATSSRRTAT